MMTRLAMRPRTVGVTRTCLLPTPMTLPVLTVLTAAIRRRRLRLFRSRCASSTPAL